MKSPSLFYICFVFTFLSSFSKASDSLLVKKQIVYNKIAVSLPEADKFALKIQNDPETDAEVGKAMGSFNEVEKKGSYVDYINPNNLTELPLGIRENRDNVEYGIVVTKVKFTPDYALINAYARVVVPQQGMEGGKKELYFGAEGIKLSYSGKIIGEAKLSLLGNINIPFNQDNWLLTLEGGRINKLDGGESYNNNTYVIIDCNGIKELSLKGNIQISRNVLVPLNEQGKILAKDTIINGVTLTNRVRGDFSVKATDWNDLLVKVNISPFAITSQARNSNKGYFSFFVNNAILDLSDLRTDPSVVFPEYYQTHGYLIDGVESWRGLYVQSLYVGLPQEFKTKTKRNAPISFTAENLLIDSYGVSGSFTANNVFPLKEGTAGGTVAWRYSLDQISVDLAASHLVGASLAGKIQLPIQEASSALSLAYRGSITEEEYLISVTTLNDINFDLWRAKATIEAGSLIEMRVQNHEFLPRAVLNGKIQINADEEDSAANSVANNTTVQNNPASSDPPAEDNNENLVQFKDITFEGLQLQTVSPYFAVKSFGARGTQRLANFPASISDIFLVSEGNKADLHFGLTVGFQDKGFSASGELHIKGQATTEDYTQRWRYAGFELSQLGLNNVDIGVGKVSGSLQIMKKDPLYGNGFKAFLLLELDAPKGVKVNVNAAFGYSTFRYWGFEGTADNLNVPAGATLKLTGFTGGAFYRMTPNAPLSMQNKERAMVFVPDSAVGLTLRAAVYGSVVKEKITSFMAGFNISTNVNGGLANVGFMGEALIMADFSKFYPNKLIKLQDKFKQIVGSSQFLTDIANDEHYQDVLDISKVDEKYPPSEELNNAPIHARLAMNYDFNNKVFHANMEAYVNVAKGIIRGIGPGDRAGWAVLHIAPQDWYFYLGTPQDMIGLKMGLKNFYVEAKSYFVVGSIVPDSPPPPIEVARILGVDLDHIDYMKDLNSLSDGAGFGFGAHFKFDTGDMTALFLYARFQAGLGADIMLRNYGDNAKCTNRGGDQIGINGWYANGQAYVYLQGELGIKIKIFFIKKKIPIIRAGVAALMQMKGPNPIWMRGYLGGYYNLLGGLIKGKFRFKMEFGEECKLENESIMGGMKIITDVTPKNEDTNIDVFAIPQATFAFQVNQPIVIPEDDADHTYKIVVDKFTVTDESGTEIIGKIEYSNSGDIANFVSHEILPPNKKLKATVQVSFMEKKNGVYEVLMDNGQKAVEIEERWFTTGTAPDVIPLSNIQYAYPVVDQENYYIKESSAGYIKLKRGQTYLFDDPTWTTAIRFTDTEGNTLPANFHYSSTSNEVTFNVPNLTRQKDYDFSIYAKNTQGTSESKNSQVTTQTTQTAQTGGEEEEEGSSITMETTTKAAARVSKDGEIERLYFAFHTSKYNTFADKISAQRFTPLWLYVSSDVVSLQNNINGDEYFDTTELTGTQYTDNKPLITLEAKMNDSFADKFKKLFYNNYPIDNLVLDRASADDNTVAVPPYNAFPIYTAYLLYLDREKGNPFLKQTFPYKYDLFRYYKSDWYDLVSKAAAKYVNVPASARPQVVNNLILSSYNTIPQVKYEVKAQYTMPGNKAGSGKEFEYQFK